MSSFEEKYPDCVSAAGNIFNIRNNGTESCVWAGGSWVLGIRHYSRTLKNVIENILSFDMVFNFPANQRLFLSFNPVNPNPYSDKKIFFFQDSEEKVLEVAFLKINKNTENKLSNSANLIVPTMPNNGFELKEGDVIYCVGYPLGRLLRTVVDGVVSNIDLNGVDVTFKSEQLNAGFSGGPVFSSDGYLLGIFKEGGEFAGKFTLLSAIKKYFKNIPGFPMNEILIFKEN